MKQRPLVYVIALSIFFTVLALAGRANAATYTVANGDVAASATTTPEARS